MAKQFKLTKRKCKTKGRTSEQGLPKGETTNLKQVQKIKRTTDKKITNYTIK